MGAGNGERRAMREKIDVWEQAPAILGQLKSGVLLTTAADGKVNAMTIGWGTLGIEWGKPVFVAYVRTSRHTHELLEKNGEFTVNVPLATQDAEKDARVREILATCGSKSGRDLDKVAELGLTLVDGEQVGAPAIAELPLTLECRVIYQRDQDISLLPDALRERNYPAGKGPEAPLANCCPHTEYYGEIVSAYVLR